MKKYLGDGVYAEVFRGMVKLTTENGGVASNTIYLSSEVLAALSPKKFLATFGKSTKRRTRKLSTK